MRCGGERVIDEEQFFNRVFTNWNATTNRRFLADAIRPSELDSLPSEEIFESVADLFI